MKSLSDLLESLRKGIETRTDSVQTKVNEHPLWTEAKKYVDSLPQDYVSLVKKNGIKAKESLSGRLTRNQFTLGEFSGMPLDLIEYTNQEGGVQKVWYVITNERDAYVRYL
ncbi:MAG: hypothetical protein RL642_299 [Bacteroidota bacterium]